MSQYNSYNPNSDQNHAPNPEDRRNPGHYSNSSGQWQNHPYPQNQQPYQYPQQTQHYHPQQAPAYDPRTLHAAHSQPQPSSKKSSVLVILGVVAAVLLVVAVALFFVFRRLSLRQMSSPYPNSQSHQESVANPGQANNINPNFFPMRTTTPRSVDAQEDEEKTQIPDLNSPLAMPSHTSVFQVSTPVPPRQNVSSPQPSYLQESYASVDSYQTPISPTKPATHSCPASMLKEGDYAFVNPTYGGTTLRDGPHGVIAGHEGDKAYPGAIFEVLEGPKCDTGVNMFKLKTSWDSEFWGPEANHVGSEWWMLPIHTRQVCQGAKPTRLLVGMKAFVLEYPDDPVEVYPEPRLDTDYFYQIQPAQHDVLKSVRQQTETFDLLKGPYCDGKGANWWLVRLQNGKEGWIRESGPAHDYYYIGPYFEP